jgi:hypothetical protein
LKAVYSNSKGKRVKVYQITQKNNLTCAVSFLHVQCKATIATTLEASNCISALPIGAHSRKGFAFIDI